MDPQQLSQEEERDQAQYDQARLFISVPFEIMLDERLTLADKFIYGRALFFHELFESVEKTAAFIGISVSQAQKSKLKLEKLGFLQCIEDTGRGKRYKAIYDKRIFQLSEARQTTLAKNAREVSRICEPASQNLRTEIKESIKGEEKLLFEDKSSNKAQAPGDESEEVQLKEDKPAIYGKPEINEILDLWEEATGFDWHGVRQERFATKNLIAKYGSEATKALVRRVQRARRADDQFTPQIAKPSQLLGKYEKLTALTMWEERQAKAEAKEAEAHAPAYVPEYMRMPDGPRQEYVDVRPETPEEKAEAHRKAMEIRAKLPFYVPKEQRKAGC